MFKKDRIIDFDFEGWPLEKKTLREVLIAIGFKEEDGKLSMDTSSPVLDNFLKVLEDDGMGYCVREKYITEVSPGSSVTVPEEISLFADAALPNVDVFVEDEVTPYVNFSYEGETYYIIGFDKDKDSYVVKKYKVVDGEDKYIKRDIIKKLFICGTFGME